MALDERQALVFLLRAFGGITTLAFLAMLLPVDWMAWMHGRLGLGELPRAPIVDYLARSISALYGFHGILVLLVSTDVVRFRPIVTYLWTLNVAIGVMLVFIDLQAGLPWWWTLLEGPPIAALGLLIAFLMRSIPLR
jgi:hypothetical protein